MDSLLRDIDRERSKMQTDVDNLSRHYEKLQRYMRQYIEQSIVEWAQLVASHSKTLLLIVETTRIVDESGYAYGGESEPIRFTVLSLASGEMWDHLLHPTHSRGVKGTEYHGLTMADLEDKPRFADVWPAIAEMLAGHHSIIFGADWARSTLQSVHPNYTHALDGAFCLHNKCKEYYGEFYDLSLEKVLAYQSIDRKREQLTDSQDRILILAQVIHNLAAGMAKQIQEQEHEPDSLDEALGDLDSHPF
jgi:DNA polymerase III epsilon subunit-like protein